MLTISDCRNCGRVLCTCSFHCIDCAHKSPYTRPVSQDSLSTPALVYRNGSLPSNPSATKHCRITLDERRATLSSWVLSANPFEYTARIHGAGDRIRRGCTLRNPRGSTQQYATIRAIHLDVGLEPPPKSCRRSYPFPRLPAAN